MMERRTLRVRWTLSRGEFGWFALAALLCLKAQPLGSQESLTLNMSFPAPSAAYGRFVARGSAVLGTNGGQLAVGVVPNGNETFRSDWDLFVKDTAASTRPALTSGGNSAVAGSLPSSRTSVYLTNTGGGTAGLQMASRSSGPDVYIWASSTEFAMGSGTGSWQSVRWNSNGGLKICKQTTTACSAQSGNNWMEAWKGNSGTSYQYCALSNTTWRTDCWTTNYSAGTNYWCCRSI